MSMDLHIEPKESYLCVTVTGTFDLVEVKDISRRFVEASIEHGRSKILVDFRSLQGEPTILDRWDYAVYMASLHLDHVTVAGQSPLQFAYVAHYPLLDPDRFAETVALNRGVTVMGTDDFDNALQFLGVDPTQDTTTAQGE